jgi:nesprin-1
LLDDKWKVFETMIRSSPVLPSQDPSSDDEDLMATRQKLEHLTAGIEEITNESHRWEVRLMDGIQAWRYYQESLRLATQWIHRAESLLMAEKNANAQQLLELHAAFFNSIDERLVNNLQTSSAQLLQWLPADSMRKMTVSDAAQTTVENWRRLIGLAPVHRMKLEFLLDQDAFAQSARDIDNQLVAEQQALSLNGANTAQLLQEHLSWFGMSAGPIVNQARVLVERLEHTAACIPDLEIQQAFENIRNQWNTLMQRADWLLGQLQAIPQKWCEYETNFEDMVKWMNTVDKSVASMSVDAKSLENFNRLREEFQSTCSDVDARRESMKWLVQRLDSMLGYKSEEEGNMAQHQLEELIARYKNLVLVIEGTQGKTDLLTKCYTCRQEIQKACASLQTFQPSSQQENSDLQSLDDDIQKQEAVVKQLDGQRVAIVSLLQRGKDLQHHNGAPEFLAEQVVNLETVWNYTFDMANEKLKKLKGNSLFCFVFS